MTDALKPPKYVTIVHHVKEVSVHGRAELAYWQRYLAREGLRAHDDHGCAELVLIAAEMVWMGARFTELSVSVAVQGERPGQRGGMYLVQAFNSSRAFAWFERALFQTPYHHARTRVSATPPVSFALEVDGAPVLSATLDASRPPATCGPEAFSGPVYLPAALTHTPRAEKLFYAELSGETQIYPFGPGDVTYLSPHSRTPVVGWLVESGFEGLAWHVRPDAVHKKSQTYRAAARAQTAA